MNMASSSASTCSNSSQSKSSRFSTTLKVFKFASKGSKPPDPPMPPPKDKYHFSNRSLVSLSPDSLSVPATPVLAQPHHPYIHSSDMNQSAISVYSAAHSAKSAVTLGGNSHNGLKKSKSGFFKFARRSPRTTSVQSAPIGSIPPTPIPDENIGVPFNFQHNIHVDEGLMGLPPSWTMLLGQAGYNEGEIEEIHARRAASRAHYHTERPATPAYSLTDASVTNQGSRSTSLRRKDSNESHQGTRTTSPRPLQSPSPSQYSSMRSPPIFPARNSSLRQGDQIPIIPHHQTTSRTRSGSINTLMSDTASPLAETSPPLNPPARPVTPPRRTFHVINDPTNTPPPSYTNSPPNNKTTYLPEKKSLPLESTSTPRIRTPIDSVDSTPPSNSPSISLPIAEPGDYVQGDEVKLSTSSEESSKTLVTMDSSPKKRLTPLPPRLSLHKCTDSADLSSWGEAFLSEISVTGNSTQSSSSLTLDTTSHGLVGSLAPAVTPVSVPPRIKEKSMKNGKVPNSLLSLSIHSVEEDDDTLSPSPVELEMSSRHDPVADLSEQTTPQAKSPTLLVISEDDDLDSVNRSIEDATSFLNHPVRPLFVRRPPKAGVLGDSGDGDLLGADPARRQRITNRDSSRSSTSTITAEPATIVRSASILRRVDAYVIPNTSVRDGVTPAVLGMEPVKGPQNSSSASHVEDRKHPPSPLSMNFDSEEGASISGSSSTLSQGQHSPLSEVEADSPLTYYLDSSPSPDPSATVFPNQLKISVTDTFGIVKEGIIDTPPEDDETLDSPQSKFIINGAALLAPPMPCMTISSGSATTSTPFQRYPSWLSSVIAPLEEFIDETIDPRDYYLDLHEIAEGESGSVFAARLTKTNRHLLKLLTPVKSGDAADLVNDRNSFVAIKSVAILPSGSPKLIDLERELSLMKGLQHEHIISLDAVYVDLVEDALWIRMELMERSLADIIGLVSEGLMLTDPIISKFASDVLLALEYLRKNCIAHRDVRSDNLLLNREGVLKLTDFSNGVRVTSESPMLTDAAGVLYWQAPEVRSPPYDALQVDVWSLGATIWEMAEAEPPFAATQKIADSWPPLSQPQFHSPAFHEFLLLCSKPPSTRPTPSDLIETLFINDACDRPYIQELLSQCMAIEQSIQERDASQ